jgi:hypothetical protein
MTALRIVRTLVSERDGIRLWHVDWEDPDAQEIRAVYLETTYLERIAPRVREPLDLEGIYALEH